jgi:hypothetical protein
VDIPQLLGILGVFGLLGLTIIWLRRRGMVQVASRLQLPWVSGRTHGPAKLLQRIDALQLSPTHVLSLVRMGDRAILIGTCPSGFHLVESSSWKTLEAQLPQNHI